MTNDTDAEALSRKWLPRWSKWVDDMNSFRQQTILILFRNRRLQCDHGCHVHTFPSHLKESGTVNPSSLEIETRTIPLGLGNYFEKSIIGSRPTGCERVRKQFAKLAFGMLLGRARYQQLPTERRAGSLLSNFYARKNHCFCLDALGIPAISAAIPSAQPASHLESRLTARQILRPLRTACFYIFIVTTRESQQCQKLGRLP